MKKTATAKKSISLNPSAIVESFTGRKRIRRSFGKIREVAAMPNLIEVQKDSYEQFLQMHIPADDRKMQGLQEVLSSVFPIKDFSDKAEIDFVRYEFETPNTMLMNAMRGA
jgi:DNA-directed RNA polymerase subunit beta